MAEIGSGGWRQALESLRRAGFAGETILVGAPGEIGAEIRVIDAPASAPAQQKRALGFQASQAERIASLSEDYWISAEWIEAALTAAADVTCGPVAVSDRASYFEQAAWMWEYAHLPSSEQAGPIEGRQRAWIPAGNVVYRRSALRLEALADAGSEIDAHQALAAAGASFAREPALCAEYRPPSFGRFLADRRRWSRLGARQRPSLLRALALPPVLLLRQGRHWISRPSRWLRFLLSLPTFVVFALAQALGELDAVFGGGQSD